MHFKRPGCLNKVLMKYIVEAQTNKTGQQTFSKDSQKYQPFCTSHTGIKYSFGSYSSTAESHSWQLEM